MNMDHMNMDHIPEGVILTISKDYLQERGMRNWLGDFMNAMDNENSTYWMRLGNSRPRYEVLYIYLVLLNRIRYRFNFVMYEEGGVFHTYDGRDIEAKHCLVGCGPLVRADRDYPRKGFQGFRYTDKIF